MGCLSRIGCLVVLAGAGGVGWWLYGDQLPSVVSRTAGRAVDAVSRATGAKMPHDSASASATANGSANGNANTRGNGSPSADDRLAWATVVQGGAKRPDPLAPLRIKNGPAFVTLGAGDLATMLSNALPDQLPKSAGSLMIAMDGSDLLVRAAIDVTEIAGDGTLGRMLGIALSGRDTISFAGPVELVRPGIAQFRVERLRVKGIDVPPRLIPMYMRAIRRGTYADNLDDNGLAIVLPSTVADLRLSNSKLTLYKAVSKP